MFNQFSITSSLRQVNDPNNFFIVHLMYISFINRHEKQHIKLLLKVYLLSRNLLFYPIILIWKGKFTIGKESPLVYNLFKYNFLQWTHILVTLILFKTISFIIDNFWSIFNEFCSNNSLGIKSPIIFLINQQVFVLTNSSKIKS